MPSGVITAMSGPAFARTFVDVEHARLVAAARAKYLRRHSLVDVLLLESDQA